MGKLLKIESLQQRINVKIGGRIIEPRYWTSCKTRQLMLLETETTSLMVNTFQKKKIKKKKKWIYREVVSGCFGSILGVSPIIAKCRSFIYAFMGSHTMPAYYIYLTPFKLRTNTNLKIIIWKIQLISQFMPTVGIDNWNSCCNIS